MNYLSHLLIVLAFLSEVRAEDVKRDVAPSKRVSARSEKEEEIRHKLTMSVSLDFKKTPFRQVVDDLRVWSGINIVVDKRALKDISMDQPVEMKGDEVMLRSALRNILHPMGLTYVIEDEMLKITTRLEVRIECERLLAVLGT